MNALAIINRRYGSKIHKTQKEIVTETWLPKFSFVPSGVNWFVERGQFRPNSYIPKPEYIIFIDWGGDGTRDHVGIVEKCDGKTVYTIEGNSEDMCKRRSYSVGSKTIFGYGVPRYPDNPSNKTDSNVEITRPQK